MLFNVSIQYLTQTIHIHDILAAKQMSRSSCLPNVLLDITNIYTVNNTSCAQQSWADIPSLHQYPVSPILFEGLRFSVTTGSADTSSVCNDTITGLQLHVTTSLLVEVERPQCGADNSCVMKFNTKQLATVKRFFQCILSSVPQATISGQVATSLKVDTSLMCENGSVLAANGKCCSEGEYYYREISYCKFSILGCDCGSRPPVDITIVLHFTVEQLSSTQCSQLNYTKLISTIVSWMSIGGELVRQFGGHLELCANPTADCDEMVRLLPASHDPMVTIP